MSLCVREVMAMAVAVPCLGETGGEQDRSQLGLPLVTMMQQGLLLLTQHRKT